MAYFHSRRHAKRCWLAVTEHKIVGTYIVMPHMRYSTNLTLTKSHPDPHTYLLMGRVIPDQLASCKSSATRRRLLRPDCCNHRYTMGIDMYISLTLSSGGFRITAAPAHTHITTLIEIDMYVHVRYITLRIDLCSGMC